MRARRIPEKDDISNIKGIQRIHIYNMIHREAPCGGRCAQLSAVCPLMADLCRADLRRAAASSEARLWRSTRLGLACGACGGSGRADLWWLGAALADGWGVPTVAVGGCSWAAASILVANV